MFNVSVTLSMTQFIGDFGCEYAAASSDVRPHKFPIALLPSRMSGFSGRRKRNVSLIQAPDALLFMHELHPGCNITLAEHRIDA